MTPPRINTTAPTAALRAGWWWRPSLERARGVLA